jgi:hypothetical protein
MAVDKKRIERLAKASFALAPQAVETPWEELPDHVREGWKREGYRAALNQDAATLPLDEARARFAHLTAIYEKGAGKRDKLMHERDRKIDTLGHKAERAFAERIKKANEGLYEVEMERAALVRALGGKTTA